MALDKKSFLAVAGIAGSVGTALVFFTQTPPDQATENISKWLAWSGLSQVPEAILGLPLDQIGRFSGYILLLFTGIFVAARLVNVRPMTPDQTRDLMSRVLWIRDNAGTASRGEDDFPGTEIGMRDDYDVVPAKVVVRADRIDDGIDVYPLVTYRNRSKKSVKIKPLKTEFALDGRSPDGPVSSGVNDTIGKESTEVATYNSVRLYSDKHARGSVRFAFAFGSSKESMRTILDLRYDFIIRGDFPGKGVQGVLDIELFKNETYYVSDGPLN